MAKRGRPTKKVVRRRKEAKAKTELMLLFAILVVVAILVGGYLYIMNK